MALEKKVSSTWPKLVISPEKRLVFRGSFTNRLKASIFLKNRNRDKRYCFKIKSNAPLGRMKVFPRCGIVEPLQTVEVSVTWMPAYSKPLRHRILVQCMAISSLQVNLDTVWLSGVQWKQIIANYLDVDVEPKDHDHKEEEKVVVRQPNFVAFFSGSPETVANLGCKGLDLAKKAIKDNWVVVPKQEELQQNAWGTNEQNAWGTNEQNAWGTEEWETENNNNWGTSEQQQPQNSALNWHGVDNNQATTVGWGDKPAVTNDDWGTVAAPVEATWGAPVETDNRGWTDDHPQTEGLGHLDSGPANLASNDTYRRVVVSEIRKGHGDILHHHDEEHHNSASIMSNNSQLKEAVTIVFSLLLFGIILGKMAF